MVEYTLEGEGETDGSDDGNGGNDKPGGGGVTPDPFGEKLRMSYFGSLPFHEIRLISFV